MNYRTEKRKANVGERILITNAGMSLGEYENGDVFEVKSMYKSVGVKVSDDIVHIRHAEYEVIIKNEAEARGMTYEIEARYEKAVEQAREAVEELRLAALAKGYEDAKRELQAGATTPTTAQAQRDAIVEQAKRDVAELSTTWRPGCPSLNYGPSAFNPASEKVNFDVNAEKRTVVCYITYHSPLYEKTRTSFRGIAKCAPTDCFNAHIGKAIALRRALGLEVPAEYLNAPQPTEVREGDVIDVLSYDTISVKTKSGRTGEIAVGFERNFIENGCGRVVDDTRDGDAE